MSMSKNCQEIKDKVISLIASYNQALKDKKSLEVMTAIEASIKDAEAEFALQSQNDLFAECKRAANPVLEGVKRYSYQILRHKLEKDNNIVTGMELVEDREKQIDLAKLCKYCGLATAWTYTVEKAGELLCIRAAKELGMLRQNLQHKIRKYGI